MALVVLVLFGALRPFSPQNGGNLLRDNSEIARELDLAAEAIRNTPGSETLSITAPSLLLPHFSERNNAFLFPEPVSRPDMDQYDGLLRLECPDPNLVAFAGSEPPEWSELLAGYESIPNVGVVQVYRSVEEMPDQPCSSDWLGD